MDISTPRTLTASADGVRLDRFIVAGVPDLSRTRAQGLIATGAVTVNGRTVTKAGYALAAGDIVTLPLDVPRVDTESRPIAEAIPIHVVYEDSHLLVVEKPTGMVVHPSPGHAQGTLVNALLAHTDELAEAASTRPGILHRLDRDTSGLLLVAKDDATLAALGEQMRARTITKVYLALIEGALEPPNGSIEAPIGRDPRHRLRMAIVTNGGRAARTIFETEQRFPGRSLMRVTLVTGRTHQIRVHFAAIGHPVVGDALYGDIARQPQPPRLFLHATHLAFTHPVTDERLAFTSPLPPDLLGFITNRET